MGAWGVGPFDNDEGADIRGIWDRYIAGLESTWGADKISSFFEEVFFRGSFPVASEGSANSIIAIAQKFSEASLALPERLGRSLSEALHLELSVSSLDAWVRSKEKRRRALLAIAERHGLRIELEAKHARGSVYQDEIESLRRWFDNLERICAIRESMSGKEMEFIDSIKPAFGKALEARTYGFYDENDEDGSAELGNLRYMYLVWLVLFDLKRDTGEIAKAVEDARL